MCHCYLFIITTLECDIQTIRENSKNQLLGGWFNVTLDDDRVRRLHEASSRLATVQHGTVVEAYRQVYTLLIYSASY